MKSAASGPDPLVAELEPAGRVGVHSRQRQRIRLWIPVLPVAVLLSPLVLLLAIALAVVCLANRIDPIRALRAGWDVVRSLPGTRIQIEQGGTAVQVRLS
jgi:hypothetical protein